MVWPQPRSAIGKQTFESRWYSGNRLVVQREMQVDITSSPFHFWSNVFPIDFGPGPGRYEVYANGTKIGEKSFEVVAAPNPGQRPPPRSLSSAEMFTD